MSVHQLAHHLQSAGRGEDKVLVHMTPKEVGGLQALAMANGGSLTINPHTGLPEAGFLKSILPMIAGMALAPLTAGTSLAFLGATPFATALTVGGITGLATGSLKDGLMAGLGAYGGAGLGASLSGAGAAAGSAAANTGVSAAQAAANSQAGQLTATGANTIAPNAAANTGVNAVNSVTGTGSFGASSLNQPLAQGSGYINSAAVAPQTATQVALSKPVVQSVLGSGAQSAAEKIAIEQGIANQAATAQAAAKQAASAPTFENMGKGFRDVTSSGTKAWQFVKDNPMPFIAGGVSALSGMNDKPKGVNAPAGSGAYIRPYDYSVEQDPNAYIPNGSTAERRYFTEPRFTARPIEKIAKEGGLMALNNYAVGGPVEQMAALNSTSGNTMYPQSQLQTTMYSNPMVQRPMPNNVVTAGVDAPVNPYTGEMRMASGGLSKNKASEPTTERKYAYDPESMKFTETTTTPPAVQANKINMPMPGYGYTGIGMGGFNPMLANLAKQKATQQTPQPTVTTETSGGIAAPYIPQGQAAGAAGTSLTPDIQLQPQRTPEQQLGLDNFYASMNQRLAEQGGYAGFAAGGMSHLGDYSDGGRLLRGPGDGVSDSIPASIGNRQPARLADGEFVVPARIVSEIGNGSTEAGARKLYAMMDRVQKARGKTTGKNKVAVNTKSDKHLPA